MAAKKFKFDWNTIITKKQEEEKKGGSKFTKDERFYTLATDKSGNGSAVIRFLPDKSGNPWVKFFTHEFKYTKAGAQKWWIEKCRSTFGFDEGCPICNKNLELYNSEFQSDKDISRDRKRKQHFISNILVVKDPANPENEGKVFLYKYGIKIFEKVQNQTTPDDETKNLGEYIDAIPFDLYEGLNFTLSRKIVSVNINGNSIPMPNYDKSSFSQKISPAANSDEKIQDIMAKAFDLSEFLDKANYPTNETVVKTLGHILGVTASTSSDDADETDKDLDDDDIPWDPKPSKEEIKEEKKPAKKEAAKKPKKDDDDDDLNFDDDEKFLEDIEDLD